MGLHGSPTEQQGHYRYDPANLDQKGPARIFPYGGEDGVTRYVLAKLRHNLLTQGQLSQPWTMLLEQLEGINRSLEQGWAMLATYLVDLEIFQSGWFNFDLPPNEQFDAAFVRLRRAMTETLLAARKAAETAETDATAARSQFYQALEADQRQRPLLAQIHARDGGLSDREFARQRLAGPNPMILRRVASGDRDRALIESWATQTYLLQDGTTADLRQAVDANRLFMADYPLLGHLSPADLQPGRYVGSPQAVFYLTDSGLQPVLIQLEPGRVVTPGGSASDDWMRSKLYVQTADVTHHELITHLCDTHLRMEAFAIATPRQLPANHPLHRLLRPHFQFLLAINTRGNAILLGEGAAIDKLMAPTREASLALINRAYQTPFQSHALPTNIQERGIEPEWLPDFPYRDDALLLWEAIANYVNRYLQRYYPDDQAVAQDAYLQAWAAELGAPLDSRPRAEFPQAPAWMPQEWLVASGLNLEHLPSYARVPDFPSGKAGQTQGKIIDFQQLVDVATQIIFTCGPQHAAVNFSQFDYIGYPPNAPLALYGRPDTPTPFMELLPNVAQEIAQMELTFALSGIKFGQLGSTDLMQFVDAGDRQILEQFQADLITIETKINSRNQQRQAEFGIAYPYLLPSQIPNSINI